ncbi:MAG: UDP-N-acetylglucosamine--N-acetylmuramyl-(pentapeptide) pyrophosphoryl-undecaprenol N-acetylglucosamine transferase, partial [Candidatus Omnitrophota bacterium]
SANKLPRTVSPRWILFVFLLTVDVIRGFAITLMYRPSVVVGFGGYVSFPVVLSGWMLRVPTVIHEQNVALGRANKKLIHIADKIAFSFDESVGSVRERKERVRVTGNPTRSEVGRCGREEAIRELGLDDRLFTILILGGSQGSERLNEAVLRAVQTFPVSVKKEIQIVHISGENDFERLTRDYASSEVKHRVFSFVEDIAFAYGASDLAISRSGSSAMFELAKLAKPMILVPYPYADQHQKENAAAFSSKGAAIYVDEKEIGAGLFADLIIEIMHDRPRRERLSERARMISSPDASDRLADEVIQLAEGRTDVL